MRTTILLLLICTCCLIAAPAVWGQAANTPANRGILGFLDPHTGAFRPVPATAGDDEELPAATTFTGTLTVTITITMKTTGITSVSCQADTTVIDNSSSLAAVAYDETDNVAATGTTTKTCSLKIPYSWALATQSSDNMSTSYIVTGVASAGLPIRQASRTPLDTRKVPANGAITSLTAAVTL